MIAEDEVAKHRGAVRPAANRQEDDDRVTTPAVRPFSRAIATDGRVTTTVQDDDRQASTEVAR